MTWKPSAAERKKYGIAQREKELVQRLSNPRLQSQDVEKYEEMRKNLPKKPPIKLKKIPEE